MTIIIALLVLVIPMYADVNQDFVESIKAGASTSLSLQSVNIKYQTLDGENFLSLAAYYNRLPLVQELIKKGVKVDFRETNGNTPLLNAAQQGNKEIVHFLLENKADPNAVNIYLQTPLIQAIYRGHLDVAQLLLEYGAKIDAQDSNGDTALHYAIKYQPKPDFVTLLFEYSPNVNLTNRVGWTPFQQALTNNNILLAEQFLYKDGFNFNDVKDYKHLDYFVYNAAVSNNYDLLNTLLNIGGDPNSYSQQGIPTLQGASSIDATNIVSLLLEKGANIEILTSAQSTPLTMAVYAGELDVVKLLISQGANINHVEQNGDTPLHIAVRRNNPKIVEFLLAQKNINVLLKNAENETPYDIAQYSNHKEIQTMLE